MKTRPAIVARRILRRPSSDDDGRVCVLCGNAFVLRDGAEPTRTCDPCAQDAAVMLARHVVKLERRVARLIKWLKER
jgi:hypothetical protein